MVNTVGDDAWGPPGTTDAVDGPERPVPSNIEARRTTSATEESQQRQSTGISFHSIPEALEWWYRPVLESETWVALAYLFVGAVLGPLLFAAAVLTVVITSALVATVVGLLLVVPAFALIDGLAAVERKRAGWIGEPIEARRLDTPTGSGWSAMRTRLADADRWRQVAFLLVGVVSGPVFFAVGFLPWSLLLSGPLGFGFSTFSLPGFLGSAVLLGVGPRATRFVADVAVAFAAWFLGPDPNADLEERVEELSSQRDQILDAVAMERRRIERNLHDGVQQQLVALGIDIGRAHARLDDDPEAAKALLGEARDKVRGSIGELRMIGRGLHPAVLSDRGLDAALSAVVANAPIPISVDVTTEDELATDLVETSYYIVNEAVANVLKHAHARSASIRVHDERGGPPAIRITVHDDGCGGADASRSSGSGLAGIAARVNGIDGEFTIDSPEGGPTVLTAVLPVKRKNRSDDMRSVRPSTTTDAAMDAATSRGRRVRGPQA
jgi:signal transduction histidine kinase